MQYCTKCLMFISKCRWHYDYRILHCFYEYQIRIFSRMALNDLTDSSGYKVIEPKTPRVLLSGSWRHSILYLASYMQFWQSNPLAVNELLPFFIRNFFVSFSKTMKNITSTGISLEPQSKATHFIRHSPPARLIRSRLQDR